MPKKYLKNSGAMYALLAAFLFGASTPAAKILLQKVNPILLAGLLYLGSGLGILILQTIQILRQKGSTHEASLKVSDGKWLAGATLFGGILGPVFLMMGLSHIDAASGSLLLNLEGVLTSLIAWVIFKEHFDKRIVTGMILIFSGGLVLSWSGKPSLNTFLGPALIIGACLAWAIDNNLTRKISASNPLQISLIKSLSAGLTNLILALFLKIQFPHFNTFLVISVVGFLGYGLSLICFVLSLRHIGTSRTGAYFSLAPFIGVTLSLFFVHSPITWQLCVAGVLMGLGVFLHLTEHHSHEHLHEVMEHEHSHTHDEHHQHLHDPKDPPGEPHSHWHKHESILHAHPHFPDLHHRHQHS